MTNEENKTNKRENDKKIELFKIVLGGLANALRQEKKDI